MNHLNSVVLPTVPTPGGSTPGGSTNLKGYSSFNSSLDSSSFSHARSITPSIIPPVPLSSASNRPPSNHSSSLPTITQEEQLIRQQLEFLFSDSNLHKDEYLRQQLRIGTLPLSPVAATITTKSSTATVSTLSSSSSSSSENNEPQQLPLSLLLSFPSIRTITILGDYDKKYRKQHQPPSSSSLVHPSYGRTYSAISRDTPDQHRYHHYHHRTISSASSTRRERRHQQSEIEKQQIEHSTLKASYAIASLSVVRAATASPHLWVSKDGEFIGRKVPYVHNPSVQDPYYTERTIYVEPISPFINNQTFLQKYFSQYGKVTYIRIPRWSPSTRTKEKLEQEKLKANETDYLPYPLGTPSVIQHNQGSIRGFAFIEFENKESVDQAIHANYVHRTKKQTDNGQESSFSSASFSTSTLPEHSSSSSSVIPTHIKLSSHEQKMWTECDNTLRILSKMEWENRKKEAHDLLQQEKQLNQANIEYGTLVLPKDTMPTTNINPSVADSTDNLSTPNVITVPYPLHVLIRLANIPNDLSFHELRQVVQVPGRPAYIDCPTIYNNSNRSSGSTSVVQTFTESTSTSHDASSRPATTCTAIVRYFTPTEAQNAYTYFHHNSIQLRNHTLTVTLIDGMYEQQYWSKILTKQQEYQYQQERIRQFNDANTSMIEGWGGSSVRIPLMSTESPSIALSLPYGRTMTMMDVRTSMVPWISDQDATFPETLFVPARNGNNTKEYFNLDNPYGTSSGIITVASVLQQHLQGSNSTLPTETGNRGSNDELNRSTRSMHRKRRRGFSEADEDTGNATRKAKEEEEEEEEEETKDNAGDSG